jgi:hypothetical protein
MADRASPALAETEIDVEPAPLPDAPLVILTKESVLAAVQRQFAAVNTLNVAVPPAAGIDTVEGETENVHGVTETVMCSLPVAFA